jgi:hypothetical protein
MVAPIPSFEKGKNFTPPCSDLPPCAQTPCHHRGRGHVQRLIHAYEICPRKDHRGVDLISDVLAFGRLWYAEPNAISNVIGYAKSLIRLLIILARQIFAALVSGAPDHISCVC